MTKKLDILETLKLALLVVAVTVFCLFSLKTLPIDRPLDYFHEGEQLAVLQAFENGKHPFDDIYLQHGLHQNFTKPYVISLISDEMSLERFRYVQAGIYRLGVLGVLLGVLLISRSAIATGMAMLLCEASPYLITDRFTFAWWAAIWAYFALRRNALFLYVLSGIFAGVALLYSLEFGLYSLVAILSSFFILTISGYRVSLRAVAGFTFSLMLAVNLQLAIVGSSLSSFVSNSLSQIIEQGPVWGLPIAVFHTAWSGENGWSYSVFLSLVLLIGLVIVCWILLDGIVKTKAPEGAPVYCIFCLLGLAVSRSGFGRADPGHVLLAFNILTICAASVIIIRRKQYDIRYSRGLMIVWSIVSFGIIFKELPKNRFDFWQGSPVSEEFLESAVMSDSLRGKIGSIADFLPEAQYSELVQLETLFSAEDVAGRGIYDFTNQGLLYFIHELEPPSRHVQTVYASSPKAQDMLVAELERWQPEFVMRTSKSRTVQFDGITVDQRHPLVLAYILDNYEPYVETSFNSIWRMKKRLNED